MPVSKAWAVDDHLRNARPESVHLYSCIDHMVRECGAVTLEVSKTAITYKGWRRGFAGVKLTTRGVSGYLDLTRSLAGDGRITRSSPYTKRLFVNHYRVVSPDELDETFRSWIQEAYAVGQGQHLG
jgi:hypothetical protein